MEQMKVAIYHGIESVTVETRPIPKVKPKDVLVKNVRAGLCGTDLSAYYHGGEAYGIYPENEFGHEMSGVVCEVGSEVKDIHVGMRVFVNPTTVKPAGTRPLQEIADMAGAFSQYVLVEEAAIDYNIFLLPENVSFDEACLVDPFTVGNRAVNRGHAKAGERAVIYGAGTIGLLALAALKAKGINDVVIIDIVSTRLAVAQSMGAIIFNPKTDGDLKQFLIDKFGGGLVSMAGAPVADVDLYLDAAGLPHIIPEVLSMCKRHSRMVVIAVYQKNTEFNPLPFLLEEFELRGTGAYDAKDIKEVIGYLADKRSGIENIITHHFKLDEINTAFATGKIADQAIKVVIDHE